MEANIQQHLNSKIKKLQHRYSKTQKLPNFDPMYLIHEYQRTSDENYDFERKNSRKIIEITQKKDWGPFLAKRRQ